MLRAHCGRHVYQVHISFLTGSMTMEAGVANCQSLGHYGATYCHQLQTDPTLVLDELQKKQKTENNQKTISKMMGTLVQVQLHMFSYKKNLFSAQKLAKIAK